MAAWMHVMKMAAINCKRLLQSTCAQAVQPEHASCLKSKMHRYLSVAGRLLLVLCTQGWLHKLDWLHLHLANDKRQCPGIYAYRGLMASLP